MRVRGANPAAFGGCCCKLHTIRSERQLMKRLELDLLFRWFVGIGVDDAVWDHSTFFRYARSGVNCRTPAHPKPQQRQ